MASELSNYMVSQIFGWVKSTAFAADPAAVYLGLFSADPTAAGTLTNEVTTTIRVAGRVACTFGAEASREIKNSADVDFGNAAGGATVTHVGLFDAASAGNMITWSPLDTPRTIVAADPVVFPTGDVKFNFN